MIHLTDVEKRYRHGDQQVLACAVDRLDIVAGEQVALFGRGTGHDARLRAEALLQQLGSGVPSGAGA